MWPECRGELKDRLFLLVKRLLPVVIDAMQTVAVSVHQKLCTNAAHTNIMQTMVARPECIVIVGT